MLNRSPIIDPNSFFFPSDNCKIKEKCYEKVLRSLRIFDSKMNVNVFPGFRLIDAQNLFGGKSCIRISVKSQ